MSAYSFMGCLLLAFCHSCLFAQNLIPEPFSQYKWGEDFSSATKKLKSEKILFKSIKNVGLSYPTKDESIELKFEHGLIRIRSFKVFPAEQKKESFAFLNKKLEELVELYGDYTSHRTHPSVLMLYSWKMPDTEIMLIIDYTTNTVSVEYEQI